MDLQKLLSHVRRAVDNYSMITENDTIAIGISGGKDSLTLLYALAHLKRFYPIPFSLKAITIDLGFGNQNMEAIQTFCQSLDVPYVIEPTQIAEIVFQERKEKNPCSLCAKLRKGCLNEKIKEMGCNKVAYAHHSDDFIETMMLSLLYEGRFHAFSPITYLDRTEVTVLRPLMYCSENEVKGFTKKYQLPVAKSLCPMDGYTKREDMKNLIRQLEEQNHGTKKRLFHALETGNIDGWPPMTTRTERCKNT